MDTLNNISLDLVRVTEAAAIEAAKWIGSGNKLEADKAATDAMRSRLNKMEFAGRIVMGEGEKDKSYGLYYGEKVGGIVAQFSTEGSHKPYDIAVDPIDGTTPTVNSGPEAIATIALSNYNSMYYTKNFYMLKIAYGPKIKNRVPLSLNYSLEQNLRLTATALNKPLSKVMVCILNRSRHNDTIAKLRNLGVRIKIIQDCDISGAIASCLPSSDVDFLYGVGGSPEAILSACAIKAMGGGIEAREYGRGMEGSKQHTFRDGKDVWVPDGDILGLEDLVAGPCVFAATGITDGSILKGVRVNKGVRTQSVFMRSQSGTTRWITTWHGN